MLWLNVFNLLPLGFLDGGRFLEGILFSRARALEILFRVVGYGALAWIAITGHMWVLGLFVLMSLRTLPLHWRLLTAAKRIRQQWPALVPDPNRLDESESRALFDQTRSVIGYPGSENSGAIAGNMQSILDALKKPPGWLATIGLLALYGAAVIVAVIGIVGAMSADAPSGLSRVTLPDGRVDFPAAVRHFERIPGRSECGRQRSMAPTALLWTWRSLRRTSAG
jgi:hypothetical protein